MHALGRCIMIRNRQWFMHACMLLHHGQEPGDACMPMLLLLLVMRACVRGWLRD
jgi:hypothetical protein